VLCYCSVLRVLASERDRCSCSVLARWQPVRTAAKFVIKLSTENKNLFVAVGLAHLDPISRV
jgi:hypothetical protein